MSLRISLVSALIGAALLSACGSSEEGAPATTPPDTSAADAAVAPPDDDGEPKPPGGECADKDDGAPCGDPADDTCNGADTCRAGECEKNLAVPGTRCGGEATDCTEAGVCDSAGKCNGAVRPTGAPCGDPSSGACSKPDSCDGEGTCLRNDTAKGTACGNAAASPCDRADACDGKGKCDANLEADGTACGSPVDNSCNRADRCLAGACETNVAANGTLCTDCPAGPGKCGLCQNEVCPTFCAAPTSSSVSTTTAGGNSFQGNMFDVLAAKDLMVFGMDVNAGGSAAQGMAIYSKVGTHVGAERTPAAWTQRGVGKTDAAGNAPFVGAVAVALNAGERASMYVTRTDNVSLAFTNGTAIGAVAGSDANLQVFEGTSNGYPFGPTFEPRVWNGALRYALGTKAGYAGGGTSDGEMFDVLSSANVSVRGISVNLATGTHEVHVYMRAGSHVGFEGKQAEWIKLGGPLSVTSTGAGAPTPIPLAVDVAIPQGKRVAFYVTTAGGGSALIDSPGALVGQVLAIGNGITIVEGTGVKYPFGAVAKPRAFNGTLYVSACP